MRNIFIFLFSILLLTPPTLAHTDVIVYNNAIENHDTINAEHENKHHENDSEKDKNTEHHHHCNTLSFSNIFLPLENQIIFSEFYQPKELIGYNKDSNYYTSLEGVFHPPKF